VTEAEIADTIKTNKAFIYCFRLKQFTTTSNQTNKITRLHVINDLIMK